jgi:hypothetical protein
LPTHKRHRIQKFLAADLFTTNVLPRWLARRANVAMRDLARRGSYARTLGRATCCASDA